MGNRHIFAGFIFIMLAIFAGCSGSSGTTGSSRVTISFGQAAKAGKTVFAGSTTATTSGGGGGGLPSIVKRVTITVTAPDITTITRTINIATGQTTVTDSFTVPNGTGRVFTVIAQDNYGNTPYTGTATADLSGTAVSLPITMVEDVTQAITAKLYQYFKDTIEAKGTALTTADLEPFYATVNFGMQNGMNRTSTVTYETGDYKKGFLSKGMTSLTVTATPSTTAGQYIVTGRGTFADGSYGFPDDGFVMVKENGEWKITGNNYLAEVELRSIAAQWLGAPPTTPLIESGLLIRVEDRGNQGIASAVVQGPGLLPAGISLSKDPMFPLALKPPTSSAIPTMQYEMYVIDDATLSGMSDPLVYTVSLYDSVSPTPVEVRAITLPVRPWLRSELTAGHFPAFSGTPQMPPVSAATDGHYLADARIGGTLAFRVGIPTAFTPSWFDTSLNYYGWDALGQRGFYMDQDLLLTATSASLVSTMLMPEIALGGSVSLTADDFDNKRQTMTTWLFKEPVATMTIPFTTSTPPDSVAVTTTPAWKYGGAAPVVTWGGNLVNSSSVEIFLLADDPQRVATATTSSNLAGTNWVKLTPTVVPGSSGSFTLTSPVETLGIVGRGCRVMVVSTLGDYWALSPSFTISP